jgi:hypothetical protein
MPKTSISKKQAETVAKSQEGLDEKPLEEKRLQDRFFDTLVEQCLAQVDLNGLAGEVARLVAPQIGIAVSVENLAADIAAHHREELAAELSRVIMTRLTERR